MPNSARVFILFDPSDERWRKALRLHLDSLARRQLIVVCDETEIGPGSHREAAISLMAAGASAVIALISPSLLASQSRVADLCELARRPGLRLLPLHVRPTDINSLPPEIKSLQPVNDPGRPLSLLRRGAAVDQALVSACNHVARACGVEQESWNFSIQPVSDPDACIAQNEREKATSSAPDAMQQGLSLLASTGLLCVGAALDTEQTGVTFLHYLGIVLCYTFGAMGFGLHLVRAYSKLLVSAWHTLITRIRGGR